MQILIVDNEKTTQPLFSQYFRNEINCGIFQFHFASSEDEALAYLRADQQSQIELILSDITHGANLIKIFKTQYPHVSVFTTTAHADENNYRKALANGTDDFISKPMNLGILKQKFRIEAQKKMKIA